MIMSRNYKFHNQSGLYFISFATISWIDVFTREEYFNIIIDSLHYCRTSKGMNLYAYCIMTNHVHLIFQSETGNASGLIRDFKTYTSKKMLKQIQMNPIESRKEWMLNSFRSAGAKNSNVKKMQFWQQHNKPIELWSNKVIDQKLNYIHENPVKAGFVTSDVDWKYSSARNYAGDQMILEIDLL